ncbi:MAG: AI-2E family transporter [Deferrisomatales bacterium]|nr:AI-2E family transporter [Deferrisomatales bacterium]
MTNPIFHRWSRKYFSHPEAVILAVLLTVGFAVVLLLGRMLAPVFASVVLAYLLEAPIDALARRGVRRRLAVYLVFTVFLAFLLFLTLGLAPLLSQQVTQLVQELPNMIATGQRTLLLLPERYPNFVTEEQVVEMIMGIRASVTRLGQGLLSVSLASLSHVFTILVYMVLLPVLVFFLLKDKEQILGWLLHYLPQERGVAVRIWEEMDLQIGNYVRGKFAEILIVAVVSYAAFAFLGLNYAMLLGALVGLSVIIPYVGAIAVTVPVLLIGFFQWGWSAELGYLTITYLVIQALDGNLLVPWLFSEAVNLHPIAIIVAVLLFGGLWGFWGVFFAIPLATLVKAVVNAWPRSLAEPEAGPGA